MSDTGSAVRILLSSKYQLTLRAYDALLNRAPGISVVGGAVTLAEVAQKFKRLQPDVLIADVVDVDQGLDLLTHFEQRFPSARIVVLSVIDDPSFARMLLNKGVSAYVLKSSTENELILATRYASEGRKFLDPAMVEAMTATGTPPPGSFRGLSKRESEVLGSIVRGFTNQEIGDQLQLSVKTVETYRARIYTKLNLKGRFELIKYAIAKGLVSVHERIN